jgi:hypothetical protein
MFDSMFNLGFEKRTEEKNRDTKWSYGQHAAEYILWSTLSNKKNVNLS